MVLFMKTLRGLFLLLLAVFSVSCIPHKDTLYFVNKSMALDSLQVVKEMQKPYRVQINDILTIRVKALDQDNVRILNPIDSPNLNMTSGEKSYYDGFTVDAHGNIRMPTLGTINVLGYTTEEIEKLLETKLLSEQFKATANIFVTVKLAGMRFTVMGEVGSPGTKTLFQEQVNIFEAIANSGEIPVTGNKKEVLIVRQYPQGQKVHHIDLNDTAVMQSPYYYIQPNDIIYVKPLRQKTWGTGETFMQNVATVATLLSLVTTSILLFNRL